ncbi:CRISPR-associated protein (Cas_Cmr5) [Fibrobacter intestinalis]|uniref:CRISPR type III-B/RAMP module-associated protein Cmr5 n=1 Tax=Fibrobacter intestinalis TaxID=28122 RepID=A0A1M6YGT8_9BACT|nr:type III-B CRISPR module-associated protein Cmr5 [Fibrobacter intestinalis]SHL17524.1 CRISPR-associated protein (Cas_Cmr5) [Fibrobacter intestinalis]
MLVKTRSQIYSERAWNKLSNLNLTDGFITRARSFPALIHNAGACQAWAFSCAKDTDGIYPKILKAVAGVDFADLKKVSLANYILMSEQMMEAAQWIKTTVDALKPED